MAHEGGVINVVDAQFIFDREHFHDTPVCRGIRSRAGTVV
ncbi:hypothetical protein PATSB16_04550 [Pandoraea thiooxydans]|nr:hypothetical protein PATSB16_04550 [Pandoraea thiooxydans]